MHLFFSSIIFRNIHRTKKGHKKIYFPFNIFLFCTVHKSTGVFIKKNHVHTVFSTFLPSWHTSTLICFSKYVGQMHKNVYIINFLMISNHFLCVCNSSNPSCTFQALLLAKQRKTVTDLNVVHKMDRWFGRKIRIIVRILAEFKLLKN